MNSVPSVHGGPAKFGDRLASRGYPMEDVSTVRLKVGISQGKCGKIFSICNFNGNMTFFLSMGMIGTRKTGDIWPDIFSV